MVAVSSKHRRAFTANIGSGSTTVIDLGLTNALRMSPPAKGAEGIAVAPDGSEVWVTNRESNTVSVVDPATLKISATLEPGKMPIRVKFTPDGTRALVFNAVSGDVAIFDAGDQEKDRQHSDAEEGEKLDDTKRMASQFGSGPVPVGILMPDSLQLAFVANTNFDTITVIDLDSLKIVERLQAGREPDGLGYTPLTVQK